MPTREVHTEPGAVMGTVGYMSPEQVRGHTVDHRSDIFSFGAVLYEMLSGHRAFRGDSPADTVSAILKEDPPELAATNRNVNPGVERVVRRCLEKNREQRFHSASDLGFALEALSGTHGSGTTTVAATGEPLAPTRPGLGGTRLVRLGWTAAALFFVSTLALAILHVRRPEPIAQTMRFSLPVPEKGGYGDGLALAPDGRSVAFVAIGGGGVTSLWIRPLDSTAARELAGTEGARGDGKELFYITPDKKLMAVPLMPANSFEAGAHVTLFGTRIPTTALTDDRNNYVPAADGQRFLVNNLVEDGAAQPITLILNWAAALKR